MSQRPHTANRDRIRSKYDVAIAKTFMYVPRIEAQMVIYKGVYARLKKQRAFLDDLFFSSLVECQWQRA